MIKCWPSNRPQQHRVRCKTGRNRIGWKRIIARQKRSSANFFLGNRKLVPESVSHNLKYADGLFRDFGADTVTGKSCNFDEHSELNECYPEIPHCKGARKDSTSGRIFK